MRRAPPLLLLPLLLAAAAAQPPQIISDESIDSLISNDTILVDNTNGTLVLRDVNGTVLELDGSPEEVVRKKRTFGDIVFRGLADVLGYAVARKPPQAFDFPPPLAPVPGIDTPLAGAVPAAPAPAAPAAATAPCGAARATGPPPCRAVKAPPPPPPPPAPKAAPPCPRPRAAARAKPKPTPPPPPPPPPPCAQPRANPATPAPCAPAPAPPAPPKADNLERITSNLRLNFNFNRAPAGQAAQVTPAPAADAPASDEQAAADNQEQLLPIAIEPRAAKLPQTKPRVYVDAFVVNNGVARRVDTVDAKQFDVQQAVAIADEDYLAYDDAAEQQARQVDDDDYEDAQESRGRDAAVKQFGDAVDQFWKKKKQQRRPIEQRAQRLPENHYQNVHFGDRDLNDDDRRDEESHQSLQRERKRPKRPRPTPAETDDDNEVTTTTEDPRKSLKPRVLPPTEHNPNQIDTVTVRVPPIYREKRPRKLHRERPEHPDRDEEDHEELREYHHRESEFRNRESEREREREYEHDTDGDDSSLAPQTERPARRRRRRKHSRKTRDIDKDYYTAGDFDYYGKKVPVSKEEQLYMKLTVPPPTLDSDVARHEKPVDSGYFLEDHERLREDPSHRIRDDYRIGESEREKSSERVDDKERSAENKERLTEDKEKSEEDKERSGEQDRADSFERSDRLSPNARIRESGYQNNYVHARNVQVDDPRPPAARARQP
ncbi:hypothetical protein PYW07_011956 [Mythimna separata]|uniref:Uncharacterized protein n=1 Tax=Mythimna separata TaxID=271217 RepID=A0AAD7YLC9_MYTSE|nr:hypothetical protein PYW07_011956 [Mythimna separata]